MLQSGSSNESSTVDLDQLNVSVVMSVFDKPDDVVRTIQSVLAQQGINLEFIIVNDGASAQVIDELTRFSDPRIKVINLENQGLTKALIRGCHQAKHDFIARIDAGDVMLQSRLQKQARYLQQHSGSVMVSCWVALHTDEGFPLYDLKLSSKELSKGIKATSSDNFRSPIHASVMFKKTAYESVGGYREQFYFTQDCDLWARLLRSGGDVGVIEEILLRATFSASGISGKYADTQKLLASLVVQSNKQYSEGNFDDEPILAKAQELRPMAEGAGEGKIPNIKMRPPGEFAGNYFIASILTKTQPDKALLYWQKALQEKPFNFSCRIKWAWCMVRLRIKLAFRPRT